MGIRRGGLTTKIMALTDKAGKFARFVLPPGNAAEVSELPGIRDDVPTEKTSELLGDKAYDSNPVRKCLASLGIIATSPPKANRKVAIPYDTESYQGRHTVENTCLDAKQFRGMATRYGKRATMFQGMLSLVAWFLGTKAVQRGVSPYPKQRH